MSVCERERAMRETAIVIMLQRSPDYVVVMGTAFLPRIKVEDQPGLVLQEETY